MEELDLTKEGIDTELHEYMDEIKEVMQSKDVTDYLGKFSSFVSGLFFGGDGKDGTVDPFAAPLNPATLRQREQNRQFRANARERAMKHRAKVEAEAAAREMMQKMEEERTKHQKPLTDEELIALFETPSTTTSSSNKKKNNSRRRK